MISQVNQFYIKSKKLTLNIRMNGGLQMRLLVVEDEKVLRKALVTGLKIKEYAVDAASNGE